MIADTLFEVTHHAVDEDLGAYALGMLERAERDVVERHIVDCSICAGALSDQEGAIDAMNLAQPRQLPSAALRARLLSSIGVGDAPPASVIQTSEPGSGHETTPIPVVSRRWFLAAAAIAAVLMVAVASLAVVLSRTQDERDSALAAKIDVASYASAGGRVIPLSAKPASNYDTSPVRGALVTAPGLPPLMVVDGCPPSTADRIYRMWVARDGQRSSAGELTVGEDGRGVMRLSTASIADYDSVGVTVIGNDVVREDVLVASLDVSNVG